MPDSGNDYSEYYPDVAETLRLEKANAQKRALMDAMNAGLEEIRRLKAENDGLRERIRELEKELSDYLYQWGPGPKVYEMRIKEMAERIQALEQRATNVV